MKLMAWICEECALPCVLIEYCNVRPDQCIQKHMYGTTCNFRKADVTFSEDGEIEQIEYLEE
jgi:hypothetical protein